MNTEGAEQWQRKTSPPLTPPAAGLKTSQCEVMRPAVSALSLLVTPPLPFMLTDRLEFTSTLKRSKCLEDIMDFTEQRVWLLPLLKPEELNSGNDAVNLRVSYL
ncbi:unnamed protein product [Pleuronectes platessa]|uniref:Uncharacterized protein n=1 Tax=Pleuronectes platessa TaxID=8262 RepID=A0A9N7UPL8_PLEPL|nr:unnamed protein product [Pleuronectes platessa]